jgi:hypothetical protein
MWRSKMGRQANSWTDEEDFYIEQHYTGQGAIPAIAEALGRSITATERRIKAVHSRPSTMAAEKNKKACINHAEDLLASGGRWS